MEESIVSSSEIREIATRFIRAWNADGAAVIDQLAESDLKVSYSHFPEPVQGADAFKAVLAKTHRHFPDMEIEADDILVEGDQAVVYWTYRATHQQGEVFGVSARGRPVQVSGVTRYQIAAGKVTAEWGIVDNFSLMLQLGAVPMPQE